MELTDIINNIDIIPDKPGLELETYTDNRTKAYLLYRDEERVDVLVIPFGDHIKGKKDLSYYIRFLPNNVSFSATFQDAKIKEHVLRDGSRYLTVEEKLKKAVIPFRMTKGLEEIPYKIMGNSFARNIAECNEQVLAELIKLFELMYSFNKNKKERDFNKLKDVLNRSLSLTEHVSKIYNSLRESIEEAFTGEESPSTKLSFLKRKIKHFAYKDVIHHCLEPQTLKDMIIIYLKNLVRDPIKHSVLSTQENKIFSFLPNPEEFKIHEILLNYLKGESEEAYIGWKEIIRNAPNRAAKRYNKCIILGGVCSLFTGNYWLGAGLFILYGIESRIVKYNIKETGIPTGMIGTIRDKLGLTVKPFNHGLISEDYDIGMWRNKDLE